MNPISIKKASDFFKYGTKSTNEKSSITIEDFHSMKEGMSELKAGIEAEKKAHRDAAKSHALNLLEIDPDFNVALNMFDDRVPALLELEAIEFERLEAAALQRRVLAMAALLS